MRLRERLKKLFSTSFIKDVAKLSIGTFAGKAITVATLPLLTRIYSPEDFALLAVYMALVSTISIISCLRYEIAIPLAGSDEDAANLLIASISSLVVVVALVVVTILLFSDNIINLIRQPSMRFYLWLVPLGIAATGIHAITQNYSTRARWFSKIAKIRIAQAFVGNSTSLVFGCLGVAPLGLLIGNLINTSAGGFRLLFSISCNELEN
jgi:O-antigen/teichoic acid export membrane protein